MHRSAAAIAPTEQRDFRWVLRQETEGAHDELDHLISKLDLASRSDFITFLKVHDACFAAMARHMDVSGLDRMVQAIRNDLTALGEVPEVGAPVDLSPFHPLAGRYILAGSRMGTQVLRKRWLQSDDSIVRTADTYFTLPSGASEWQAVCAELSQIPAGTTLAEEITRDTGALFQFFRATLDRLAS